jgi:hypothetical protein
MTAPVPVSSPSMPVTTASVPTTAVPAAGVIRRTIIIVIIIVIMIMIRHAAAVIITAVPISGRAIAAIISRRHDDAAPSRAIPHACAIHVAVPIVSASVRS